MKPYRIVLPVILLISCLSFSLHAALPPRTISYQGYLKDAAGKPVTAATNLTFRLYSSTRGTTGPLWSEVWSVTPANGVYSVELGSLAALGVLPFDRQYFLGVTVGSGVELTPRQPLTSAPYAIRAGTVEAGSVTSAAIGGTIDASKLDLSGVVKKGGDSMTGPLTLPANGLTAGGS